MDFDLMGFNNVYSGSHKNVSEEPDDIYSAH
jgi:hypothetical protein